MAFPVIETTATSQDTVGSTSYTVNNPTGIASGDLIVHYIRTAGGAGSVITWPGDYTELFELDDDNSNDRHAAAYKFSSGGEPATITVTITNAFKMASLAWRISGVDTAIAPSFATAAGAVDALTADPPSLTPAGGAKDYLWMAIGSQEGENTFSSHATNYTLGQLNQDSGVAGAVATNVRVAGAGRQLNASVEDPGVLTWTGTADAWMALTLAIHPGAAAQPAPILNMADRAIYPNVTAI